MIDRKQIVNSQCSFSEAIVTGAARPVTQWRALSMQTRFAVTNFHRFTLDTRSAGGEPPSNLGFLTPESDSESPPCQTVTTPRGPGGPAVLMMAHTPAGSSESGEPESESPWRAPPARRRITGSTMPRTAGR